MLKNFLKDSLIYSVSNMLSRGINILLVPFYTRVLSPSDYGIVDIVIVIMGILNPLLTLEISQGIARFYCDTKSKTEQQQYASTALWFTLGVYTIFAIFTYFMPASVLKLVFNDQISNHTIVVTILCIWSNGLMYLIQNQLKWGLRSKICALVSLTCTVTSVLSTIILVLMFNLGVVGVLFGVAFGNIFASILGIYFIRSVYVFNFNIDKFKRLITFSFPLVPSMLGVMVALYIDRLMIKEFLSFREVGLYGMGYRVASIANLVMFGVQGSLMPLIYTHYKEEHTPIEIARIFHYFVAFALLAFGVLTIFSKEILIIFTTPEYYDSATIIPFLVLAVILSGMYIFAPGLGIAQKTKLIAILNIATACINTILNFLMVPKLGILGAALSTFISALITLCLYQYFSQKIYRIPYLWSKIILNFIIVVALASIGLFFIPSDMSLFNIIMKAILIFICIIVIALYFIGSKDLVNMFRKLYLFLNQNKKEVI